MKRIEAFIRPEKLEDIKDVFKLLNLNGLSVSQVMGCGNQMGWKEFVRGTEVEINFLSKIKLEIVVEDEQVSSVVDSICEKAYTGEIGDGKIFISNIEEAIRIRTKEKGIVALK